ncbi:F0F1 ATP synthase subunit epsilon [Bradyrhizobium sp.]|uniref:F0F1 ATP synthase subunit epsilon n=1 Tax=Bradyrhizobium sp. TaxID=376 RepID=UPI003BB0FCB5
MPTFQLSLVSPESLLFSGQVDQVDLPGLEGDFGVLSGHAPIVAVLRPGIVTAMAGNVSEKFVVLGGLAEFSDEQLTILADAASPIEDFDLAALRSKIEEIQQGLEKQPAGDELDRAVALLDHYKSIHTTLAPTTAF